MRLIPAISCAALAMSMSACGSKSDNSSSDKPQVEAPAADDSAKMSDEEIQARKELAGKIPTAAIIRVPVNEKGETIGAPEMRVSSNDVSALSESSIAAEWESAAAPQRMVASMDELDGDSSTQSWLSFNLGFSAGLGGYNYGYGNNYYGYGNNYYGGNNYGGNNYGGNNYGGNNYGGYNQNYWSNTYRPVMNYQGYNWNYGYYGPQQYNGNGCNYYSYTPTPTPYGAY